MTQTPDPTAQARRCTCGAPPDSIHEPICDLLLPPPQTPPAPEEGAWRFTVEPIHDDIFLHRLFRGDEYYASSVIHEGHIPELCAILNARLAQPAPASTLLEEAVRLIREIVPPEDLLAGERDWDEAEQWLLDSRAFLARIAEQTEGGNGR